MFKSLSRKQKVKYMFRYSEHIYDVCVFDMFAEQ